MTGPPPPDIERELDVTFGCANKTLSDARSLFVGLLEERLEERDLLEGYDGIIKLTRTDLWIEEKNFTSSQRQRLWEYKTGSPSEFTTVYVLHTYNIVLSKT